MSGKYLYVVRNDQFQWTVGRTDDVWEQFEKLQGWSPTPLELVAGVPDYRDLDLEIKEKFKSHRTSFDWYSEAGYVQLTQYLHRKFNYGSVFKRKQAQEYREFVYSPVERVPLTVKSSKPPWLKKKGK